MIFLYLWIVVQIIAESLPISSSGHAFLLRSVMQKLGYETVLLSQLESADFLLHGPTIIILFLFLFHAWCKLIFHEKLSFSLVFSAEFFQKLYKPMIFVGIVDLITTFFWICKISVTGNFVGIGFLITAIILYLTPLFEKKTVAMWNLKDSFIFGIAQGISLSFGISRFAITYAVGRWRGYDHESAFALSFLIQFPLLCVAFVKGFVSLRFSSELLPELFAFTGLFVMVIASIISYGALWWTWWMMKKGKIRYFSYYMMVPILISIFV